MTIIWVVAADNSRARIFSMQSKGAPLDEIEDLLHPEGRAHARDLKSDRPGRTYDSLGKGRHAKEPHSDIKKQEEMKFADRIADFLESARLREDFDRLVLVAAPGFLGMLRKQLSAAARQLVTQEIRKNLVNKKDAEIRHYLV